MNGAQYKGLLKGQLAQATKTHNSMRASLLKREISRVNHTGKGKRLF